MTHLRAFLRRPSDCLIAAVLLSVCLIVLIRTVVPTIYTLDSAEFITGAWTQGIVHAPGYPLFLVILRLFLELPLGDIGLRGNLFSTLCLALSAPILFITLRRLGLARWVAVTTTLVYLWSYQIWLIGLFAEVYAPQILTVVACCLALARLRATPTGPWALTAGVCFGLAVALHPISLLFGPAMILAFRGLRISWRTSLLAALVGLALWGFSLLYLPNRYAAGPTLNLAGMYTGDGSFAPVDLLSFSGIAWMLTGRQFDTLFFSAGLLPSAAQLQATLTLFTTNYLGFGLILGIYGLYVLGTQQRGLLAVWLTASIPFTYFYTTYGALDRDLMFGPALLLWAMPFGFGLQSLARSTPAWVRLSLALALPLLMLVINFPRADLSQETSVRGRSEAFMQAVPAETVVFAHWVDITPLEYLQLVEGQRGDLQLYNLFLYPESALRTYLNTLLADGRTVWIVDAEAAELLPGCTLKSVSIPLPEPDIVPFEIFEPVPAQGNCL